MKNKEYYVYIIINKINTTFYIGIKGDLIKRIWEHKNKKKEGFTSKYNIYKLVYFESCSNPNDAIAREKQLKNWKRQWKVDLIKKSNPSFNDLSAEWYEIPGQARNDTQLNRG